MEKSIALLKEEYTKLQRAYVQLERKYNEVALKVEDDTIVSGFVCRLVMTVASLYKKSIYSDICIRIGAVSVPAHKFVLQSRSDEWNQEFLISRDELDWSNFEEDIGIALLQWIYTDIADLDNDRITLGLLRAAHCFKLQGLMGICERALVVSANIRSCVKFYGVAEEVGAITLLEYCSSLISTHWDDLASQDFEHMSGAVLYKMLKSKTKYPLHAAVRLLREDVVFLCLVENDSKVSMKTNYLFMQIYYINCKVYVK